MSQQLKLLAVYKHFKHTPTGPLNNYLYVTLGVSNPMSQDKFTKLSNKPGSNIFVTDYTEGDFVFDIIEYNGVIYHNVTVSQNELVIYKCLYDNNIPYARPKDMFLGPVDKNKYPNVTQKYRFELYNKGE